MAAGLLVLLWPNWALADMPSVVISQLQTGTTASASQEFVELKNLSDLPVSLEGWTLDYKSATSDNVAKSWSTRAKLSGSIAAHGYFLIAPTGYLSQADSDLSSGLAASGGHVRLVDNNGNVIDLVGWGTANAAQGLPAPAPPAGQSLERSSVTGDNAADFAINPNPDPKSSTGPVDPPEIVPSPDSTSAADLEITELLVNPASPQTDAKDEFIELHNAGDSPVSLQGLILKTGSDFHDSYSLPNLTVQANGYLAVYARDSHLSLTNNGGAAELVDSNGNPLAVTPTYGQAPEGASWASFDSGWQWTLSPTPGAANQLTALPTPAASTSARSTSSSSKSAKISGAKSGAKSVKTSQPKSAKSKVKAAAASLAQPLLADAEQHQSKWLIIAALALTIGYAIYEFRFDIQNFYLLAVRKFKAWRKDRSAAAGRPTGRAG